MLRITTIFMVLPKGIPEDVLIVHVPRANLCPIKRT